MHPRTSGGGRRLASARPPPASTATGPPRSAARLPPPPAAREVGPVFVSRRAAASRCARSRLVNPAAPRAFSPLNLRLTLHPFHDVHSLVPSLSELTLTWPNPDSWATNISPHHFAPNSPPPAFEPPAPLIPPPDLHLRPTPNPSLLPDPPLTTNDSWPFRPPTSRPVILPPPPPLPPHPDTHTLSLFLPRRPLSPPSLDLDLLLNLNLSLLLAILHLKLLLSLS